MTDTLRPKPPRVYQHVVKKAEWGYAVLLEEQPQKRTFRFEDGKERSFAPAFYEKMVPVDLSEDEAASVAERALAGVQGATSSGRKPREKKRAAPKKPSITFDEQLAAFRALHPLGFDDVTYSTGGKGRAIRRARRDLAKETFGAKVEAGDFDGAHALAVGVVAAWKSSVPKGDRARLAEMTAVQKIAFTKALAELLHGEGPYNARFDAFVRALAEAGIASWQLATLFPALVEPDRHVLVRGSLLRKQALVVDVVPGPLNPPRASTYERLRAAAEKVRERLVHRGETPKDLFDVVAFSKKTLAPKKA